MCVCCLLIFVGCSVMLSFCICLIFLFAHYCCYSCVCVVCFNVCVVFVVYVFSPFSFFFVSWICICFIFVFFAYIVFSCLFFVLLNSALLLLCFHCFCFSCFFAAFLFGTTPFVQYINEQQTHITTTYAKQTKKQKQQKTQPKPTSKQYKTTHETNINNEIQQAIHNKRAKRINARKHTQSKNEKYIKQGSNRNNKNGHTKTQNKQ